MPLPQPHQRNSSHTQSTSFLSVSMGGGGGGEDIIIIITIIIVIIIIKVIISLLSLLDSNDISVTIIVV